MRPTDALALTQRAWEGCMFALQCQGGSREAGHQQRRCDAQDPLGADIGRHISSVDANGVGVASMRSEWVWRQCARRRHRRGVARGGVEARVVRWKQVLITLFVWCARKNYPPLHTPCRYYPCVLSCVPQIWNTRSSFYQKGMPFRFPQEPPRFFVFCKYIFCFSYVLYTS